MAKEKEELKMSEEEQKGYHKGCLSVLAKEREEFVRLLQIVEQLMYAHIDALKKLGVDLQQQAGQTAAGANVKAGLAAKPVKKKPIDEMIR